MTDSTRKSAARLAEPDVHRQASPGRGQQPPLRAVRRSHPGDAPPHAETAPPGEFNNRQDDLRYKTLHGIRTLIVEDQPVDQKIILAAALQLSLRPVVVDNSTDAFDQLRHADAGDYFDLVLIDFKLPHLNGLSTSRTIKTKLGLTHPPKVVLLSAYHRDDVFGGGDGERHVDDFLTKPILPARLAEALCDLADTAARRRESWPNPFHNDDEILAQTHVLLAEDNEINQRVAAGILKRRGVTVTLARDGREAVDQILNAPPDTFDIVLMDVDMPVLDGYDATREIRRHHAHLPVIALTAHNSREDRRQCMACGMSEYLTKPIKPPFLFEMLLRFLR